MLGYDYDRFSIYVCIYIAKTKFSTYNIIVNDDDRQSRWKKFSCIAVLNLNIL